MADDGALSLPLSADERKMEAALNRATNVLNRSLDKMEARAAVGEKRISAALGGGGRISSALDKVFDSSRLAVLEEGSTRLRVFGSALEPLGGYGLAAAAGVAALGLAIEEAKKTAEWAEGIERTAKALNTTTTRVQEFDHVFNALGIDVGEGRRVLQGLSEDIGNIESGAAKAQQVKIFTQGLKITPEQLRGWGTLDQQLPHVLEAMSRLNGQELQGFSTRLKVDPGALASLVEGRNKIADLIDEAHRYGIVIDADVIAKSAEAADKMRTASDIIDKNLKASFAGLAGTIAGATTELAHFIGLLNSVPKTPGDRIEKGVGQIIFGGLVGIPKGIGTLTGHDDIKPPHVSKEDIDAELGHATAPSKLIGGSGHAKHGPADRTDQLTKTASDDLDNANKALAEAQKAQTDDDYKRADFEEQAINDEAEVQQQKLKADVEALLKDKSIDGAQSDLLQAKIEQAQAATEAVRQAKIAKADRDAYDAATAQALSLQREVNTDLSETASIQAQLARTSRERNQLETANLLANQQIQRRELQAEIDKRVAAAGPDPGNIAAEQGAGRQRLSAQSDLFAAQRASLAQSQEGPLAKFARESTSDQGDKLQANAVQAIGTLNDGLVEAALNAKKATDVLKDVGKQFLSNLLKQGLNGIEGSLLGGGGAPGASAFGSAAGIFGNIFKLFGFGGGTGPGGAPGGLAIVGEHGPELANVPRGSQITPNNGLRALLNGPGLKASPARLMVSVANSYDMRGNSGDAAVQGWIAQSEARTKASTFSAVQRALPGLQATYANEHG